MDINQLIQFRTIAEQGTMTKAAETLYVSQPALSQNLAKLEKELGIRLFHHYKNRIRLNENGRNVLQHVRVIEEEMEKIRQIGLINQPAATRLRLASSEDPSLRYFGATIMGSFPELDMETRIIPAEELASALLHEQADIIFSNEPLRTPHVFTTYLCEVTMHVSVPPTHPFYGRESLSWQDLNGQSFLMPEGYSYLFDRISRMEKEKNIHITRKLQRDFSLYRRLLENSPYLVFTATLDHLFPAAGKRKDLPVADPEIRFRYYASCLTRKTSLLLPYFTCIQSFYWGFEE